MESSPPINPSLFILTEEFISISTWLTRAYSIIEPELVALSHPTLKVKK